MCLLGFDDEYVRRARIAIFLSFLRPVWPSQPHISCLVI